MAVDVRWLALLAVLIFVANIFVYRWMSFRSIRYSRAFSKKAVDAGEEFELVEVLENGKILPIPSIIMEATFESSMKFSGQTDLNSRRSDSLQSHRSYFVLYPHRRITRRHTVRCVRRGVYDLKIASMTCADVFGISMQTKTWNFSGDGSRVVVYPPLIPRDRLNLPSHSYQGDTVVRRWIMPDPFLRAGSRPYQAGDPLNLINWKATARTQEMQVHQSEYTADFNLKILVNFEVREDMWGPVSEPARVDSAISLAATLATMYIEQGIPVGFACNGISGQNGAEVNVRSAGGQGHLETVLTAMAVTEIKLSRSFQEFMRDEVDSKPTNTDYLIVTGFTNLPLETMMDELRGMGNTVDVLPLPTEAEARSWFDESSHDEEATTSAV